MPPPGSYDPSPGPQPQTELGAAPSGPEPGAPEAERSGPRLSVIVGVVLVSATVLVLGVLGVVSGLSRLSGDSESPYAVGDCVVRAGTTAEPADCGTPEAFRIVSEVNDRSECPDPTQPAVEVTGPPVQVFCLTPASEASGADEPPGGEATDGAEPAPTDQPEDGE